MIPLSKISQLINAFNLKLPWYSFDLGNVHFVTFSSKFSVNYNGPQYRFVEKDLVHAKSNGSKWIVVFVHKPSLVHIKVNSWAIRRIGGQFPSCFP